MNKDNKNKITWLCETCDLRVETAETIQDAPCCPTCRRPLAMLRKILVSDLAVGHEFIDLKAKDDKYPSRKKLRRHIQTGIRRGADKRLVELKQIMDRNSGQYEKKVVDYETGEIIRDCKEPLRDHRGRGSARKKKGDV
jgi:hypothetical protein